MISNLKDYSERKLIHCIAYETSVAVLTLCFSSPTVQVPGVHGVRHASGVHQHGLGLPDTYPVPLCAAIQHLIGQAPMALFHRRSHHTCHLQDGALHLLAGECGE